MARRVRGSRVRKVALSDAKDDLSRYLRLAETEEIVITRHGHPAGVLIGFGSDDEWLEYRLLRDPQFLAKVSQARQSIRAARGVRLKDLPE